MDGGDTEYYDTFVESWGDCLGDNLFFAGDLKYRIKHVEPLTDKELFLREAKHYESIEQMFDSGKFKLVADGGEE